MLTYARHVQAGRFPYSRVSSNNIELPQAPPEAGRRAHPVADAADAGKALDEFSPPHEAYRAQGDARRDARQDRQRRASEIADGPRAQAASQGPMEDARVPLLRERLGLAGEASDSSMTPSSSRR